MYALIGCSLLSVTLTIERAFFWWRHRHHQETDVIERACLLIGAGKEEEARALIADSRDIVARVIRFGNAHQDSSFEAAVQMAASIEIRMMRKFLKVQDTIVTVAPLLGILGTVLGIITSFDVIGGGRIDNPIEVTGGIAEALLTTAAGLVVAIIALVPYNYFIAKMEDAVGEMECHLTAFEIMRRKGTGDKGVGEGEAR